VDKVGHDRIHEGQHFSSIWAELRLPFVAYRNSPHTKFSAGEESKKRVLLVDDWVDETKRTYPVSFSKPVVFAPAKYPATNMYMYTVPAGRLKLAAGATKASQYMS
jgi:hypothetical protein